MGLVPRNNQNQNIRWLLPAPWDMASPKFFLLLLSDFTSSPSPCLCITHLPAGTLYQEPYRLHTLWGSTLDNSKEWNIHATKTRSDICTKKHFTHDNSRCLDRSPKHNNEQSRQCASPEDSNCIMTGPEKSSLTSVEQGLQNSIYEYVQGP